MEADVISFLFHAAVIIKVNKCFDHLIINFMLDLNSRFNPHTVQLLRTLNLQGNCKLNVWNRESDSFHISLISSW